MMYIGLNSGIPACTRLPAQYVDFDGIGQSMCQLVRKYFEQGMGQGILVIVDVGLDHDAVHAVDGGSVIFMKGELDVRFAEFDLLVTRGGIGMEKQVEVRYLLKHFRGYRLPGEVQHRRNRTAYRGPKPFGPELLIPRSAKVPYPGGECNRRFS
jgi:hypothetical protein